MNQHLKDIYAKGATGGGFSYPPDFQEKVEKTVLAQAELLCAESV